MTCQILKEIEFRLRLNFNDSDAKMEVNSKIHQSRKTRFVVNAVVRAASAPGLSKKEKTKRSILGPCTVTAARAPIRQVWICIRSGVSQLIKLYNRLHNTFKKYCLLILKKDNYYHSQTNYYQTYNDFQTNWRLWRFQTNWRLL